MVVLVLLAACSGESPDSGMVTSEDFGDEWPFTVDQAALRCEEGMALVVAMGGTDYALNGVAISRGYEELVSTSEVWRDNPSTGAKVSLHPVTRRAETLC